MSDLEKAMQQFRDAGLAFPTIPEELASQLKELSEWLYSTRPVEMSPYNLQYYVDEVEKAKVNDYALISHSGHGANSYAIQYYLVRGSVRMFLHLGWGGAYMGAARDAANIRECFAAADKIVLAAETAGKKLLTGNPLTVVASDFYGSYRLRPGESHGNGESDRRPIEVLTESLEFLAAPP